MNRGWSNKYCFVEITTGVVENISHSRLIDR